MRAAVFAHYNSKAFVPPCLAHLKEERGQGALVAVGCDGALVGVGGAPIVVAVFGAAAVGVGVVVVELHRQATLGGVGGYGEVRQSHVGIAAVGLNDEVAAQVVAAGGSHGIDESLVEGVLHGVVLFGGRESPVALGVHLVGAGKGETSVVGCEGVGDVCPQSL